MCGVASVENVETPMSKIRVPTAQLPQCMDDCDSIAPTCASVDSPLSPIGLPDSLSLAIPWNAGSASESVVAATVEGYDGNGNGGEVMCWVGSACHDLTSPFTFTDVDDEKWGYAEKSTVLVFGRIGVSVRDGEALPNLKVMGVYANNRRSRRRVGGGDTGSNQFE